jgi:hypothetical protein
MRQLPLDTINAYEKEYENASESRKDAIFNIYKREIDGMMVSNVGGMLRLMWMKTSQMRPELEVIDDPNYMHMILGCSSEEAQKRVLHEFLDKRKGA